jgi:rsbT co-antagonist protein RsbR
MAVAQVQRVDQARDTLLEQILQAIVLAATVVLLLGLIGMALPAMRTVPVFLLMGVVAGELLLAGIGLSLARQHQSDAALLVLTIGTELFSALASVLLRLPAICVGVVSLMITIGAFLRGARFAVPLGLVGLGFVCATIIILEMQLPVLDALLLANTLDNTIRIAIQITFLAAILSITVLLAVRSSDQLRTSLLGAEQRASEAEQARSEASILAGQLTSQVEEQKRLIEVIEQLEIPLIPLFEGVVVLPLVGNLDTKRCVQIEAALLNYVAQSRTNLILADISAVPTVDTAIAARLMQMGQAARLLGATMTLTGIKPAVAQTIVHLGVEQLGMRSYASIEDALNAYLPKTQG